MANRFELPKDPTLAGKVLETEHAARIAEMGKLGAWLGSRETAVIYLAWSIIIASIIGATVLGYVDSTIRPDMAKALAALAIAALSYMFGRSSASS